MNTQPKPMISAPKTRAILLLMPMVEKSEWVSAKWSTLDHRWISTWGWVSLYDPVAWDELPPIPEELQGERAFVHRPVVTEEKQPDSPLSVRGEAA